MLTDTIDIKETLLNNIKNKTTNSGFTNIPSLLELRQEAVQAISQLDIPTSKHEEWKYTDIHKALKKNFTSFNIVQNVQYSLEQIEQFKYQGLDAYYLVFINGQFEKGLSNYPTSDDKLVINSISDAFSTSEVLVQEHFSKHINFQKDIFLALSTAFADEGILVKVEKGQTIEIPIVFLFISDSTQGNTISQPRNLIHVGTNSSCTIIENYISVGANPQFTNMVSEMIVEENGNLDTYRIQNESEQTYHVGTTQVHQSKNSNFSSTTITTKGAVVRNNLNIKLDGENCTSHMYGLYLLDGKTHVDNHTAVDHAKPHSFSNELYKGVMSGKSTGVFNGKIFVRQDAQKTNAFQSNRNVLLSDDASIHTKPQLEIWADDVKCSHGATTGQIDEEALFYLQSRGISKESAKALLMIAFANEVVTTIKVKEIQQHVEQLIEEALHTNN